jgi:hypothetical protein
MAWVAPRTWVAGEIVTAALGNQHWRDNLLALAHGSWGRDVTTVVKSADETVTNSATLQLDNHLLFTAAANAKYLVDVVLIMTQTANAVGADFKMGFSLPAGASWSGGAPNPDVSVGASAAGDGNWAALLGAAASALPYGLDGNAGNDTVLFLKALVEIAGTAGTVTLQWAQNTATAAVGTTVQAKSWLRAERVA